MITTTQAWKNYFVDSSVCAVQMSIRLTNGVTLTINTDRIMEGSLTINDEICQVGDIDIGSTVSQEIRFDISNHDGRMNGYNFNGARCILYLIAGTSIQKGVYYLYTSNNVGRVISLYGYDHMADEVYNTPLNSSTSFSGMTCLQAVQSLGFTLASTSFPNNSYVLPTITVGDMGDEVTARDVLGWICEICGCYARYNNLGSLVIKPLGILEFGNNLDGGMFVDEGNKLPYPYKDTTKTMNGITWTDIGDGRVQARGHATGDSVFRLTDDIDNSDFYIEDEYYTISNGIGSSITRAFVIDGIVGNNSKNTKSFNALLVDDDTIYDRDYTINTEGYSKFGSIVLKIREGTSGNLIFKPMFNVGKTAREYISYADSLNIHEDSADGGLFMGAYGRNKLPYPYAERTKTENGLSFYTVTDTGSQILVYGTATADTTFMLQQDMELPVGRYMLWGIDGGSMDTYRMVMYRKEGSTYQSVAVCFDGASVEPNLSVTNYFTVESGEEYTLRIIVNEGSYMGDDYASGTLLKPMILSATDADSTWEYYMKAWTAGDAEDGGLFGFWNRSGVTILSESDATALSKIMQEPTVSNERFMVTGVKVTNTDIEESVGTDDYMIEIIDNPFVTTWQVAQAIASQVYAVVSGVNFYPFSVSWSADPSFEAGDLVSFECLGRKFTTICTSFNYTLGNMSQISCNESDLNNT